MIVLTPPIHDESAHRRAAREAEKVWQGAWFRSTTALLFLVVGACAAVVADQPSATTTERIAIPVIAGAVALGLPYLATYLSLLIMAPYRQRDAARRELRERQPQGGDLEVRLREKARQARAHSQRMGLRRGFTRDDESFLEQWTQEVVVMLSEEASTEEAGAFIDKAEAMTVNPIEGLRRRADLIDEIVKARQAHS